MPNPSLSIRYLLGALAAAAAVALIVGCGGSSSPMTPLGAASLQSPAVKGHCPAHGGVRVDPCTVTFNASNPGPDTVTVRTPKGKKSVLSESDNCGGASGIATVTQGTGEQWTVTAGSTTGSCTATLSYVNKHGKTLGYANLSVTNSL